VNCAILDDGEDEQPGLALAGVPVSCLVAVADRRRRCGRRTPGAPSGFGRGRTVWLALMALRAATPPARLPSRHQPFDARHHRSGSPRPIWSKSSSALGALKEAERRRREAVVPLIADDRRPGKFFK